jgi:hypothetical protein
MARRTHWHSCDGPGEELPPVPDIAGEETKIGSKKKPEASENRGPHL